jgi:multidrug transporter EmrE-like cation transporter
MLPVVLSQTTLPATIWPYLLASALAEAVYYRILIRAYERVDFSLAYPVARGTAPALIVLWSMIFLGEHHRSFGLAGVIFILAGLMIVARGETARKLHGMHAKGLILALLVAVM